MVVDGTGTAWQACTYGDLWKELQRRRQPGRRLVIGIDGRSGSGKTTLAAGLAKQSRHTAVIHTDDIAWHHSFFGWGHLLVDGLLEPFHDGLSPIQYKPESWRQRGRPGAITIPATTATLVVEGVGVAAREIRRLLDVSVWVDTPMPIGRERVCSRGVDTTGFIDQWMAEEAVFLDEHRPWDSADLWVNGQLGQPAVDWRGTVFTANRR